jgi:hypothetical protein
MRDKQENQNKTSIRLQIIQNLDLDASEQVLRNNGGEMAISLSSNFLFICDAKRASTRNLGLMFESD